MAIYFVGDIQGCYQELTTLLDRVSFDPSEDQLWPVGDLIARGPNSLETMRLLLSLGDSVKAVLGNHDLHFLATYHGIHKIKKNDKLEALFNAHDIDEIVSWLKAQPLVRKIEDHPVYMSHAGLPPQWTAEQALKQSDEASKLIQSEQSIEWLKKMYGNTPNNWEQAHTKEEKFRFTINALTRMRFCYPDGSLDFNCKSKPSSAPKELKPWFNLPNNLANNKWLFGHWAALLGHCENQQCIALDTGCVWGHHMTMLKWPDSILITQQAMN